MTASFARPYILGNEPHSILVGFRYAGMTISKSQVEQKLHLTIKAISITLDPCYYTRALFQVFGHIFPKPFF